MPASGTSNVVKADFDFFDFLDFVAVELLYFLLGKLILTPALKYKVDALILGITSSLGLSASISGALSGFTIDPIKSPPAKNDLVPYRAVLDSSVISFL